jgi:UDPglucose 6-dehydrogenase
MLNTRKSIVNKSTELAGTSHKVRDALSKNAANYFDVLSNPEFLRGGCAVDDFTNPARVVIGAGSGIVKAKMT